MSVETDKGMANLAEAGVYPQNDGGAAGEVVLTRTESQYVRLVLAAASGDPLESPTEGEISSAAEASHVTAAQRRFIESWVVYKGDLFLMTEEAGFSPSEIVRYLQYPATLRILTEASRLSPDVPSPVPSKEELAAAWGVVSRSDGMPLSYQKEARQELSKLLGYYTTPSDGTVNVGVQVVLKGDLG